MAKSSHREETLDARRLKFIASTRSIATVEHDLHPNGIRTMDEFHQAEKQLCWSIAKLVGGLHRRCPHHEKETESAVQSLACVSVHNITGEIYKNRGTAWAVGPNYLVTCKHVIQHENHTLETVYISHPNRPAEKRYDLSVHAMSQSLDIAILYCRDVQFHRLAVDERLEPYMTVYHIECLDVSRPVVHKGWFIPGMRDSSFYATTEGSSEAGFSGGPVVDIWGRCVGTFKGRIGHDDVNTKVFIKNHGLLAFLDGLSSAGHGSFFQEFGIKKWFSVPGTRGKSGCGEEKCAELRARAWDQAAGRRDQGEQAVVTRDLKKGWEPPRPRNEVPKTW